MCSEGPRSELASVPPGSLWGDALRPPHGLGPHGRHRWAPAAGTPAESGRRAEHDQRAHPGVAEGTAPVKVSAPATESQWLSLPLGASAGLGSSDAGSRVLRGPQTLPIPPRCRPSLWTRAVFALRSSDRSGRGPGRHLCPRPFLCAAHLGGREGQPQGQAWTQEPQSAQRWEPTIYEANTGPWAAPSPSEQSV